MLLFAVSNPAQAADAGSVTFATGSVTAERAPAATLTKGDLVMTEDNVITGAASRAQLLMIDGAKVAIRPNSRLVIEEYVYDSARAASGATAVTTSDDNSSVMRLVKGGFRTITGAIGKEDPSDYEVRTAVGVLGIRGTDYSAQLCRGDCDWAPGATPGSPIPDGLYLGVTEGTIVFSNEVMTLELTAGEYAYIPFDTRQPTRLDTTPPVFIDDSDLRFVPDSGSAKPRPDDGSADDDDTTDDDGTADDGSPSGFDSRLGTRRVPDSSKPDPASTQQFDSDSSETPKQSIQGIDRDGTPVDLTPGGPPDPQNRTISYSGGPLGQADLIFSGTLDNLPGQYQLDGNNNLTGFENFYPGRAVPTPSTFDIGSSANVDTGFDAMTVLRWGRWSGGSATITLDDGSDASQDLGNQSIHWISSPEWATPPVMPISGTANYTLIGSTSPTDSQGNVGVLGAATFQADFTNMIVDSTLDIRIVGFRWMAVGSGNIGAAAQLPAHLFQGMYGIVTITDPMGATTTGNGLFSGFFSQPGPTSDPSFPGGVGLTYSLQDQGNNVSVSGAAAFGNP